MARRVNTKFLMIFTIVVVGMGVLALVVRQVSKRFESPEKYVAAGTAQMAAKQYEAAAQNFQHAIQLDPRNPALFVAYGDALNQTGSADQETLYKIRDAWQNALAVDPNNKPALDRMMSFWSDLANLYPTDASVFKRLKETAERLFQADPKNDKAEVAITTSVVRPWLAGLEQDDAVIRQAVDKMIELQKKYPDNADLPMFIAQCKIKLSDRARQRDQQAEAKKLIDEANQIIDDAVKRNPTAMMYFNAAQVAQAQELLALNQAQVGDAAQARNMQGRVDAAKRMEEWRQKKRDLYTKARELSKDKLSDPSDQLCAMIYINSARASADKPEAEKILREIYAARPDDQQVRLNLAEQLASTDSKDPNYAAKRDEALAILDKPFAASQLKGPNAARVRDYQVATLVAAADMRIDQYRSVREGKDRDALLAKIKNNLDLINSQTGETVPLLRLRGKLLRMQGNTIEAIQTLERGRHLAEQGTANSPSGADRPDRWQILDLLAKAYIDTNQTGPAKDLLQQLVNKFPTADPARIALAQVLLKEGSVEEARPQIDYLSQRHPDDPEVLKLRIQMDDSRAARAGGTSNDEQRKKARESYTKLPEDSKRAILDKVVAAVVTDQQAEGTRLLNKGLEMFPGDVDITSQGVKFYRTIGDPDGAKALVATALKGKSNDPRLLVMKEQVADLSVENLMKITIEEAKKNPDPVLSELIQARAYRRLNKPDDALQHLLAAQKLKPNNGDINSLLFDHYLWQRQFDKAEALLPVLANTNQDQANGVLFRYRLAMAKEDYPTALARARELVQKMGEFGQSYIALGQALQATGQNDEALRNYTLALQRQTDSAEAYRGAITCLYALNRPGDAQAKIRDARRALPNDPGFQEMEIQHELAYGDPTRAVGPREEQYKKDPSKPANVLALGQAYLASARTLSAKGDKDKQQQGADYYAKAKQLFKQGITKWPDQLVFYAYYAESSARSGDLGDSEQLLKQLAARPEFKDRPEPQLLLAEFYAVAKRPAESEACYRDVLAKNPNSVDVQLKLSNLLTSQNKIDDALKVLEANSADPRIARRKVDILLAAGRADQAEKALDDILQRSPNSLEVLQLAAGVNISRSHFDVAEQRLKRATEIDPKDPTTHYYFGMLRMNQPKPDLDAAIKEFGAARDSATLGTDARFALADCLRRKMDPDGAIRELEQALQQQPMNKRIRFALIDSYMNVQPPRWSDCERTIGEAKRMPGYVPDTELLRREANMWSLRGEPKRAVDAINDALTVAPDDLQLNQLALDLLVKAGRAKDVMAKADALLAKDKGLWWAYSARARAERLIDKKDDAVKDFEAALSAATAAHDDTAAEQVIQAMGDAIGPDEAINRIAGRAEKDDKWKLLVARLQQTKGDTQSAVKTLEQVLAHDEQLQPVDREGAYRFGGTLYLLTGEPNKSADCYAKLLDMVPNDMTGLNNMACLLAEVTQPPRPAEGLKYSQRAYDLMQKGNRRDAMVLDTHGWLLVLTGQVDEGIDVLRQGLDVKQLPETHYHLGVAYLKKGFGDEALREFEMASSLYKRFKEDKMQVDPTLGDKIDKGSVEAGVMIRQKKVANAPAGTNVP